MNCIAESRLTDTTRHNAAPRVFCREFFPLHARSVFVLWLIAASGCAAAAVEQAPAKAYDVMYTVTPVPRQGFARVEMRIAQARRLLREVTMNMPPDRFIDVDGDGNVRRDGDELRWQPGNTGGTLRWTVSVPHRRYGKDYDAWLGTDWGLFRASDIIPRARTRTVVDAVSRTQLQFDLPQGWSAVTRYVARDGIYPVTAGDRRFDQPSGWILLGKLGVRIESIAGVRVVVGGPTGQGVRRLDMLALLHWTLPQLVKVLPDFPKRIAIVSARDAMWRGGLSGPRSLYIHAGLPLISENATSTLLHELLHVGTGLRAANGADWIVEGLAEYYALEILRRSRTISNDRFDDAIKKLARWGRQSDALCTDVSTAATTARAVSVFASLHKELTETTKSSKTLDEILRSLVAKDGLIGVNDLRETTTELLDGTLPRALRARNLPGC